MKHCFRSINSSVASKEELRELDKGQLNVIETLVIVQIYHELSKSIIAQTPCARVGIMRWGERIFGTQS